MKWFIDGYACIAIVLDLKPTCKSNASRHAIILTYSRHDVYVRKITAVENIVNKLRVASLT